MYFEPRGDGPPDPVRWRVGWIWRAHYQLQRDDGWARVLVCSDKKMVQLVMTLRLHQADQAVRDATVVRIIRGQGCQEKTSLLQEFAAAFQFPSFFGRNFDALNDCLGDLAWQPAVI